MCLGEILGSLTTAVAHIITGVIGAGVLSLPWSVAQLGWIAGPVLLTVVFPAVTFVSAFMMSDCYRYPDPEVGHLRIRSYSEAVKLHLGSYTLFSLYKSIKYFFLLLIIIILF